MNKKGAPSFTTIFVSLIIGFIIVNAVLNFINIGVNDYNTNLSAQQEQTFNELQTSQDRLNSTIQEIRGDADGVEVESGALQTFWNSFKGLGNILQVPLDLIDIAFNSVSAILLGTEIAPPWFQGLALLLIVILIVLAVIGAMTGGNSNI